METLHPIWPITGGLLIGLAAALYLLLAGRVAGISGLLANATGLDRSGSPGRGLAFVGGLLMGAWLLGQWLGRTPSPPQGSWPLLLAGGLLVGLGTRLGNGCTSGHGICGLSRLWPRSMLATAVFMGCAALTVFVSRHLLGDAP